MRKKTLRGIIMLQEWCMGIPNAARGNPKRRTRGSQMPHAGIANAARGVFKYSTLNRQLQAATLTIEGLEGNKYEIIIDIVWWFREKQISLQEILCNN